MLLENEIDLVKKMDNERYKGVKSIAKEFSDYVDNTFIDASVRQVTVDEMYKNVGKKFKISFGKPSPWQTFDKSKTPIEWANFVQNKVYEL